MVLSKEQKDMLRIIYGDDLITKGNVVIARSEDRKTCSVINPNGEKLVDKTVLGFGYVLGPSGFKYVMIVDVHGVNVKNNIRTMYGTRFVSYNTEITYYIYNDKFEYESTGVARNSSDRFGNYSSITVNIQGKDYRLMLNDCLLRESNY